MDSGESNLPPCIVTIINNLKIGHGGRSMSSTSASNPDVPRPTHGHGARGRSREGNNTAIRCPRSPQAGEAIAISQRKWGRVTSRQNPPTPSAQRASGVVLLDRRHGDRARPPLRSTSTARCSRGADLPVPMRSLANPLPGRAKFSDGSSGTTPEHRPAEARVLVWTTTTPPGRASTSTSCSVWSTSAVSAR